MVERVTGMDAAFLELESPTMHLHVVGVLVLDPSTAEGEFSARPPRAALQRAAAPHPPVPPQAGRGPRRARPPPLDRGRRVRPRQPPALPPPRPRRRHRRPRTVRRRRVRPAAAPRRPALADLAGRGLRRRHRRPGHQGPPRPDGRLGRRRHDDLAARPDPRDRRPPRAAAAELRAAAVGAAPDPPLRARRHRAHRPGARRHRADRRDDGRVGEGGRRPARGDPLLRPRLAPQRPPHLQPHRRLPALLARRPLARAPRARRHHQRRRARRHHHGDARLPPRPGRDPRGAAGGVGAGRPPQGGRGVRQPHLEHPREAARRPRRPRRHRPVDPRDDDHGQGRRPGPRRQHPRHVARAHARRAAHRGGRALLPARPRQAPPAAVQHHRVEHARAADAALPGRRPPRGALSDGPADRQHRPQPHRAQPRRQGRRRHHRLPRPRRRRR